jgi:hypothetical protein
MTSVFEVCVACDLATMDIVDATFRPLSGPDIQCLLCRSCRDQLAAGDRKMQLIIEWRLLLRSVTP